MTATVYCFNENSSQHYKGGFVPVFVPKSLHAAEFDITSSS
jgi:hypothetical protein